MDSVRDAAFLSVGRAVGYVGFAILTLMLSLSFEPVIALKSGGVLLLLLLAGLLLKAQRLGHEDYRHTEAWSLIDRSQRPDAQIAERLVIDALREACFWFAQRTFAAAVVLWVAAVVLSLSGLGARG